MCELENAELKLLSLQMICHTECICKASLVCEYEYAELNVLSLQMISHIGCICNASPECEFGYSVLKLLIRNYFVAEVMVPFSRLFRLYLQSLICCILLPKIQL